MGEARANVQTVFSDMPIGIKSLSVPIVDFIWEALLFPKIPRNPKWTYHYALQWLLVNGASTRARPVTMMTDVSSSRTVDMILQALFAYTTCANKPVRWWWTAVLLLYSHVKTIESAVQPEKRYFDFPDLQWYQCGDTMRSDLLRLGSYQEIYH